VFQAELALKAVTVLLNLCNASQSPDTAKWEARALALFVQLLVQEGGVAPALVVLEGCVSPAREDQSDGAGLHSALALAQYHLSQGKVSTLYSDGVLCTVILCCQLSDCESTLLYVLDQPFLSDKSLEASLLCAKAKLLASEYLLCRNFDLKSPALLLSAQCSEQADVFRLTAVELAMDAVKLLWRLSDRKHVLEGSNKVSCSWLTWTILLTLLRGLHMVAEVLCQHSLMSEAYCYAREGAMLAKAMHLKAW